MFVYLVRCISILGERFFLSWRNLNNRKACCRQSQVLLTSDVCGMIYSSGLLLHHLTGLLSLSTRNITKTNIRIPLRLNEIYFPSHFNEIYDNTAKFKIPIRSRINSVYILSPGDTPRYPINSSVM